METSHFFENVAETQYLLVGSLVFLTITFFLGLGLNVPAVVIYIRSRQIRGYTDKFILFVVIADLITILVFVPISFLVVAEYSINLWNAVEDGHTPVQAERPFMVATQAYVKAEKIIESDNHFSTYCVQQWIVIVHKFVFVLVANLSVLSALKITIERYLAVTTPLHYHKILKSSVIFVVSLTSFVMSIVFALIMAADPGEFSMAMTVCQSTSNLQGHLWPTSDATQLQSISMKVPDGELNEVGPTLNLNGWPTNVLHKEFSTANYFGAWWPVLKIVHASVFFLMPVIIMMYMYLRIWNEARRQSDKMANNKSPYILPADVTKPDMNVDGLQLMFRRFKLVQRLKRKARMDRAAKVACMTIGLIIVCFGLLYYIQVTSAISSLMKSESPQASKNYGEYSKFKCLLPTIFACLHPLLSPLVYVYRYKKVRKELYVLLKKLISSIKCCSDDLTDCQDITNQCNNLAATLPSSPIIDVAQHMLESQSSTNGDSDTSLTIDMSCANMVESIVEVRPDIIEICYAAHPMSKEYCDNVTHEVIDGMDNHEYNDERAISIPTSHGFLRMITCWMGSYSRRWNHHRESVTSTASFVTLLSNKGSRRTHTSDI